MKQSKTNDPTFETKMNSLRVISKKQLRDLTPYSESHIARVEKSGQFPKRIRLGPQRVGWLYSDIVRWIEQRRETASGSQNDTLKNSRRK